MCMVIFKRILLIFIQLPAVLLLFGQPVPDYVPLDYSCHQSAQYWVAKDLFTKLQLKGMPSTLQKDAAKLLLERDSTFRKDNVDKIFITDTSFTNYFNNLFSYLKAANGLQATEMQLMVSRVQWPNAYSMGEGTIVVNLGLLQCIENEAQLAFIICHEIAHYKLGHSMKHLESYLEKMNGTDVNKKIKEINKNEFGQNKAALKLLEGITYDTHRHGREHETEADSMGLIYLSHTVFNPLASLRSMQILDSVDYRTDSVPFQEVFQSKEFPFQPYWIKKQKTMGFASKDILFATDSLKTHPDCSKRALFLKVLVSNLPQGKSQFYHQPESGFVLLKKKAEYELVNAMYDTRHYDFCLYESLLFAQRHSNDPFGVTMAAKSLYTLNYLYAQHNLMESIHSPAPQFGENFNQLLRLLSRLSLGDYTLLDKAYIKKYKSDFSGKSATFSSVEKQIELLK